MKISIKNLGYSYSGFNDEKNAIKDVSLEINSNKRIAIVGHTGSGKSTLLKLIKGLLKNQTGEINIDGKIEDIGYIFQYPEHQIFETTIFKDVAFGLKKLKLSEKDLTERVEKALQLVGLDKDYLHRSTLNLSGGEKRKVALAGVFIMENQLLLLDEATVGLDPESKNELFKILLNWQKENNSGFIFSSHDMNDVLNYAEEVIVMSEGKVLYHTKPSELFEKYSDSLESLGFRFFNISEGNNIEKLLPMFRKVKDLKGPIILLVKTEKGKGYCFAEENKEKFHGIAPFNIETGNTYKSSVSYSEIFGNKILDLAREDTEIYTLSAAMIKGTGLDKFSKEFPERCIDTGIAEGFAVTFAAGLARSQKKPYVCIYSTFIQRAISQLIHDISIQNLPVRFIIDRSGIVGEDGKTHNGIYDLSFFLTIQNFTVLCPTTAKELEEALELSKDFNSGPLVIRIPRDSVFNIEDDKPLEIGKWKEIKKGSKNLFIATGTMLKIILEIHEELKNRGIDATIISAASVKPLDENYLLNYIKEYDNIFVLEENYVKNSFATSILEFLNDNGINKLIHRIALDSAIIPHGKRDELLTEERLKGESLIERIEEFVYGRKK